MSDELTVVDQKEVEFYDDQLTAVRADDGAVYVSVTQMCNALGLDAPTQRRRIQGHEVLNEGYMRGWLMPPPMSGSRGGGRQQAGLLRVDLVPLWLAGVRLSRVKGDVKDKLKRFQREAAKVLWEAFQDGRLTVEPEFDELLKSDSDAVQAYKTAMAVMRLARNQIMLEARLDTYEQRLEAIETELGSGRTITPDQATAISQAVKAIAMVMSKRTGRNEYGGVYAELYRRYRVPSYRELPASKYEDAIKWLGEWLESLTGDEAF